MPFFLISIAFLQVQGVILSLDNPQQNAVFNIGAGQPVRLRDFIKAVEKAVGKAANVMVIGGLLIALAAATRLG